MAWNSEVIFTRHGANCALDLIESNKPTKEKQLEFLNACQQRSRETGKLLTISVVHEVANSVDL